MARLAESHGGLLWIEGEPGIGKSALLSAAKAEAERLNCRVFRGLAEELAQRSPLRVLLDCLDPRREIQADDRAGGSPLLPVDPVMALVEALVGLVEELCAAGPVMLVVDDLQWADDASLLAWYRLSRLTDQLPLLLAVACRQVPAREKIAQLRRAAKARGALLLTLSALPAEEVTELVTWLVGAIPGPTLIRVVGSAGGNPLYVREAVDAYRREGRIQISRMAELDATSADAPASLNTVIGDRLSFLSEHTLEVMRMAALLGVEFSVSDLAVVAGLPPTAMIGLIDEAVAGGVLVEHDAGLGFRHGLIRQALYQGLHGGLRTALHRQAAHTLAEAGAPPARVAEQLLAVTDDPDPWLFGWLRGNAGTLGRQAPYVAEELLRRAVGSRAVEPGAHAELTAELASVMFTLGRYEEVDQLARRAGRHASDPVRHAQLVWHQVYALLRLSRYDDALLAVDGGRVDDPVWASRLAALRAMVLDGAGRDAEAESAATAVLDAPDADSLASAYALHVLSVVRFLGQRLAEALELIGQALDRLADDPRAGDLRVLLLSNRASLLDNLDRSADADGATAEMLLAAERLSGPARLAAIQVSAAEHWYLRGRWDDAAAEFEVIDDEPLDAPRRLRMHGFAALLAAHRDDRELAERHLHALDGLDLTVGDSRRSRSAAVAARAVLAEQAGDTASAFEQLRTLCEPTALTAGHSLYWLPDLVRLSLAGDDRTVAEEALGTAMTRAGSPTELATRAWCSGMLADDPAPLLEAAAGYQQAGRPFDRGRALEDAAVLFARHGSSGIARPHYEEAFEIYRTLGAEWDTRRAGARLRAAGVRRGGRGTNRRPEFGWAALTPTELRVAKLVADGLSNPEIATSLFLSRRTVESHISHILAKLNKRSRIEIAREVLRRAADTVP